MNENLVLTFARKNGTPFNIALGQLLNNNSLSSKSNAVKALNFSDPSVRGVDLKKSILNIEMFSKNIFSFKRDLMKVVGAKNENDLNKKVIEYEFKSPLIMICALGAQFNRLEQRYILDGISFQEAFARRFDFHNTLMSICHDLVQFGLSSNILHYMLQFSSELIDPKFDLNCIKEENIDYVNLKNNMNKKPNVNTITARAADRFTFDGNELLFNINDEIGCQINLTRPIFNLYNKNRQHFGSGDKKESLKQKWINGERPEYCPNGGCWKFNFGIEGCPHSESCKNKKEEHVTSHYCGHCGEGNIHPILQCEFIRCCSVLVRCNDTNWITRTYSTELKKIFNPNRNRRNNRRGFRGGYRSSFNNNSSPHPHSTFSWNTMDNEQFESNNFGQFDNFSSYNDNNYGDRAQTTPQHHHNGGRRGGRNKRRNDRGHGNNNQYNGASHNGNA